MNLIAIAGAVPFGYTKSFTMDLEKCKELCCSTESCVSCRDAEALRRLQPQPGEPCLQWAAGGRWAAVVGLLVLWEDLFDC